jgi:hypothetical protein
MSSSLPCYLPNEATFEITHSIHKMGSSAIVLEGVTDRFFWQKMKHYKCELVPIKEGSGWMNKDAVKEVVRDCLKTFKNNNSDPPFGLLGIVDEDYDWDDPDLDEDSDLHGHLVSTSPNSDIENVLFHLDRIQDWISKHSELECDSIHSSALEISMKIGVLRALCAERQRNAQSEKKKKQFRLHFQISVEDSDWIIPMVQSRGSDKDSMIRLVLNNTRHSNKPSFDDLKSRYSKAERRYLKIDMIDSRHLSRGHDIAKVISEQVNNPRVSSRDIERWLMDNVRLSDIADAEILKKIRHWEDVNKPFRVLVDS